MAMQWLMNWIPSKGTYASTKEPEQVFETFYFKRFPDLPKELRIQVWEFYFDVPRIHVLYQGSPFNGHYVSYTDITARTNHHVPAEIRFAAAAINHEALEVFRKTFDLVHINFMNLPSKQLRDLFDDNLHKLVNPKDPTQPLSLSVVPKNILHTRSRLASLVRNPSGTPRDLVIPGVYINWESDLLYLADGGDVNCEMLRRACNGTLASKLRRLAILIHDSYTYDGWRRFYGPSVDFPKPSAELAEVFLAVRLREFEPDPQAMLERDEFGFASYHSIIKGKDGTWEWTQNMKMIERRFVYVARLLREAFPDLEDHKIKWVVDVDYTYHTTKEQYSRNIR
ncbi:hypothetical protein GGS21DRAFT_444953 [Xylaria nigripes]|nr:hypothetical protein GGS21DRAFT_444953 [Xylaria nigripes]